MSSVAMSEGRVLAEIEAYYDSVTRAAARVEDLTPFTLFVRNGPGWPYYARPQLGATAFSADAVARVRARQRELGVPQAFEWVAETTPVLRAVAEAAGVTVTAHPLMLFIAKDAPGVPPPAGIELRLALHEDDLARYGAVARIGFAAPGTAIGPAGSEQLAGVAAERTREEIAAERARLRSGRTVMAVALAGALPVSVGSYQRVGAVAEITGVATLPAFRRRGIAAALTAFLVDHARRRGITTVFLSANDETVAQIYAGVGFQQIGTACIGEAG